MKIQFEIDTGTRTLIADVSDLPGFKAQVEAMRLARLYAGMLAPHVTTLEILKTPDAEALAADAVEAEAA